MASNAKAHAVGVSAGDHFEFGKGTGALNRRESIAAAMSLWREEHQVSKVFWRVEKQDYRNAKYVHRYPSGADRYYWKALQDLADRGIDPPREAIVAAHSEGLPIYLRTTLLDEGGAHKMWQTHFAAAHHEYLVTDRAQKKVQYGVLCIAYPEVREYQREWIKELMEEYEADGVYISLRTHSEPAEFADQFGFNQPIVDEYKRRYGVDILWDDFDLEAWRRLRGEYLTAMLRDIKDLLRPMGRKLAVAMPRCGRLGPPFGNLYLDWRAWVETGIVDDLAIAELSGRWLHPDVPAGYGYVGSDEDEIGTHPLLVDVNQVYGPVCRAHGCRLYVLDNIDEQARAQVLESPYLTGMVWYASRFEETSCQE